MAMVETTRVTMVTVDFALWFRSIFRAILTIVMVSSRGRFWVFFGFGALVTGGARFCNFTGQNLCRFCHRVCNVFRTIAARRSQGSGQNGRITYAQVTSTHLFATSAGRLVVNYGRVIGLYGLVKGFVLGTYGGRNFRLMRLWGLFNGLYGHVRGVKEVNVFGRF